MTTSPSLELFIPFPISFFLSQASPHFAQPLEIGRTISLSVGFDSTHVLNELKRPLSFKRYQRWNGDKRNSFLVSVLLFLLRCPVPKQLSGIQFRDNSMSKTMEAIASRRRYRQSTESLMYLGVCTQLDIGQRQYKRCLPLIRITQ